MRASLTVVFALVVLHFDGINGQGMLLQPVNRASAWRKGFDTPRSHDSGNNCGGLNVMISNYGNCGVCGDNYATNRPRANENTGTFGTGKIVETYRSGDLIDLVVLLTVNNVGNMRYAVCPLENDKELETEECFEKYPLLLEDGSFKYTVPNDHAKVYGMKARLPEGLTCKHCVLRWEYVAENYWGICEDGRGAIGCGPQETFRTCSDIEIVAA